MGFTFCQDMLKKAPLFYFEDEAFSGVKKIADKVRNDFGMVFGVIPESTSEAGKLNEFAIIYGTIGLSPILDELNEKELIDLSPIKGKNEVYFHKVIDAPLLGVKKALVIAGSDKRGTIYGLFRLSEMIGVSPLVEWCDVIPKVLDGYSLPCDYYYQSKEPSVRFRGFFINDEWPAFGNWCTKRFGGFNAQAYEHVFELLLRLKGNYLWPAMWSGRFGDDGPGLANCELADEYGVVMGMSHHEPCLRQGEEYKYLRGKDSIYGDAWNFRSNEEGITRFWEDGLKRRGKYENVITVGMRGEADTAIMGKHATMADNIELLRDVLKKQRKLIQKYVNEDLSKVPRMIALYKEVEAFYYGNEEAKGLVGCDELEDIILMMCDDNFGNLRTLPTDETRNHKGGYGMYYHFDYHGWPISFEWVNSSYLPKIWEQMSAAYDFGIRELWIVNVGDVCTQEFPLSYFLDLAYDFETWGTNGINKTKLYTENWIKQQFNGIFDEEDLQKIYKILRGNTKIAGRRRPEAMNESIYHPVNYMETQNTIAEIHDLLQLAEELYNKVNPRHLPAYFSIIYYPVVGNLNVQKMQLYAGLNQYFAKLGAMVANQYAEFVKDCLARDKALVEEYHSIDFGKWYGMGMSEHIGFTQWNEDECRNPVIMNVIPADKARIMLMIDGTDLKAEGSPWLRNTLPLQGFLEPNVERVSFTLYSITDLKSEFTIETQEPWLIVSSSNGVLDGDNAVIQQVFVSIDRASLPKDEEIATGKIVVTLPAGKVTLTVPVQTQSQLEFPSKTFTGFLDYICIEAEHFTKKVSGANGAEFRVIDDYGKTLSAVKVFPTISYFTPGSDSPYVEYQFTLQEEGVYEAELYMQPSNAATIENKLSYAIQANEGTIDEVETIPKGEKVGDNCFFWREGVLNNIRRQSSEITGIKGINTIRIFAVTPGFVLEKIVIYKKGNKPAESYLGPTETYFIS